MTLESFPEPPREGTRPTLCRPGPLTRRFMVPMRAEFGVGAFPEPGFVATAVKPWIRSAKRASPAGSPVFAALRPGRRRQLRFMGREQVRREQGTFHEPARSYACEGVGSVRKTCFVRRLTPTATIQRPDARSNGLEALHEPPGFGLRQPSGALDPPGRSKSGRGLPHSKTLPRGCLLPRFMVPMRAKFGVGAFHEQILLEKETRHDSPARVQLCATLARFITHHDSGGSL